MALTATQQEAADFLGLHKLPRPTAAAVTGTKDYKAGYAAGTLAAQTGIIRKVSIDTRILADDPAKIEYRQGWWDAAAATLATALAVPA